MALSNGIRRAPPDNQQVFKDGRDSRSFGAKGEWAVGWRIGPLPKNLWGSELESGHTESYPARWNPILHHLIPRRGLKSGVRVPGRVLIPLTAI